MENTSVWSRAKAEGRSLLDSVRKSNEIVYLILLTCYVALFFLLKLAWTEAAEQTFDAIRMAFLSMILWGTALYLFFIIAAWKDLWKKNIPLILTGVVLLAITYFGSRKMSTNSYTVVMDAVFCLLAFGKDYKKILRCILGVVVFGLVFAEIGVLAGFAVDLQKIGDFGHSLGIIYPNTWGYLTFLGVMLLWYLCLRRRRVLCFALFWPVSVFMYFVIQCRTIALLTLVFPLLAWMVDWLEDRPAKSGGKRGVAGWIAVALPFIALGFTLFVSYNYKWVDAHVKIPALNTVTYRFVHNGLYLTTYGAKLVGNTYRSNVHTYVNLNGNFIEPGILDCSYAAYAVMRGWLWIFYTMLWLCIANHKALKKRDFAIPFLCGIILVFAMIERPGLDMWYNFILLYPLAKVAGKEQAAPAPTADGDLATEPVDEPKAELPPADVAEMDAETPAEKEG